MSTGLIGHVERVTLAGTEKGLVKDLLALRRATDIGKIECKVTELPSSWGRAMSWCVERFGGFLGGADG